MVAGHVIRSRLQIGFASFVTACDGCPWLKKQGGRKMCKSIFAIAASLAILSAGSLVATRAHAMTLGGPCAIRLSVDAIDPVDKVDWVAGRGGRGDAGADAAVWAGVAAGAAVWADVAAADVVAVAVADVGPTSS